MLFEVLIISLNVRNFLMQACHLLFFEHALVLDGHYLDEVLDVTMPVVEHTTSEGRACVQIVLTDELEQFLARNRVLNQRELHHIHVAEVVERMVRVVDVGHTARHSCGEVAARLSEHHHATAGHVLAAVVASTLDDGDGSRVSDAEALADLTIDIEFA